MEFLDNIFSKILDKTEDTVEYVAQNPGKSVVNTLDTLAGQNNPLNPVSWVGNAIRGGVGKAMLSGNDTILTDPRNTDGSFKTNALDYFYKISPEDKKGRAISELQNSNRYNPLEAAGYSFTNKEGNVKQTSDIESALAIATDPMYRTYIAQEGDPSRIDLDNTTLQQIARQTKIQEGRNTIERLGGNSDGLSDNEVLGERDKLLEKDANRKTVDSPEYQLRDKERKDTKDYNLATLESNLALAKMQNEQSILDRDYLERRDLRDYNYQIKKDDQESLDKIFALLIGGVDKIF